MSGWSLAFCRPIAFHWNAVRLGRVSASRSRPYPKAAGGGCERQTAACLLVRPGSGRPAGTSVQPCSRRGPRQGPDGPRPAAPVTVLPPANRSGARVRAPIIQMIDAAPIRGPGPGRGPSAARRPHLRGRRRCCDRSASPRRNSELAGTTLVIGVNTPVYLNRRLFAGTVIRAAAGRNHDRASR